MLQYYILVFNAFTVFVVMINQAYIHQKQVSVFFNNSFLNFGKKLLQKMMLHRKSY